MPKEKSTSRKPSRQRSEKKKKGKVNNEKSLLRGSYLTIESDPNAPKRGLTAYMFFAIEQREIVRDENPGITFGQVGKVLGQRWKELDEEQRTPYEVKAAEDKKRYKDEKANYNPDAEEEEEESS